MYSSEKHYRKTWAEVDLGAIHDNITAYRQYVPKDKELMAVVKANAYGHGAIPVAQEVLAAGATWLAVALLEEAIELREAGIQAPILLFGYCPEEFIQIAQEHQIVISLNDVDSLSRALPYVQADLPELRFHLKLDTGMGRLGIPSDEELRKFISDYHRAKSLQSNVSWEGVYTHFATADEQDTTYSQQQQHMFQQRLDRIKQENIELLCVHASNSAGSIKFPERNTTNLVRVGISMYGLHPSEQMKEDFPFSLKPALSLHTCLSQVKRVGKATGISYGITYTTEKEEWIGTIPIGYADGWSRRLSNNVYALIQGEKVRQVGRICMDQCMLLLNQGYPIGEKVTLIGKQGSQEISIDQLAKELGTINYEVACMISTRVPRIYYKYGERLP